MNCDWKDRLCLLRGKRCEWRRAKPSGKDSMGGIDATVLNDVWDVWYMTLQSVISKARIHIYIYIYKFPSCTDKEGGDLLRGSPITLHFPRVDSGALHWMDSHLYTVLFTLASSQQMVSWSVVNVGSWLLIATMPSISLHSQNFQDSKPPGGTTY